MGLSVAINKHALPQKAWLLFPSNSLLLRAIYLWKWTLSNISIFFFPVSRISYMVLVLRDPVLDLFLFLSSAEIFIFTFRAGPGILFFFLATLWKEVSLSKGCYWPFVMLIMPMGREGQKLDLKQDISSKSKSPRKWKGPGISILGIFFYLDWVREFWGKHCHQRKVRMAEMDKTLKKKFAVY